MKKVLLFVVAALTAGSVSAQYYSVTATDIGINPGAISEEVEQTPAYMLANATGYTQILNPAATSWSSMQSIPFSFEFNGSSVSNYYVAPYGVVTFSSSPGAVPPSTNTALPTSDIPEMSVCAWGLNLGTSSSNDGVIIKTLGEAPRRQHWIIYSSASAPGITGWTYWGIVLEETTNHIYVVDLRTYDPSSNNVALTVGVQIDSTEAYSVGSAVGSNNGATGGNGADPTDNTYYLFGYGTQPTAELDNAGITNAYYVSANTATSITGLVVNHGSATVTLASIQYSIDGGSSVSNNLTGLTIAPGAKYEYTLPNQWTPTELGEAEIETEIMTSNGLSESITGNNMASATVLVTPTPVQRKPLLEQFTSSTCGPCTPGNANVLSIMSNYPNTYSKVNYQMSWPGNGDPYYTLEGYDRRVFYGVNSVPSMHVDGSAGINSNSFVSSNYTDAYNTPAFMNLDCEATVQRYTTYAVEDGALVVVSRVYNLNGTVTMNPLVDMDAGQVAHISINEDLTYDNKETNGETEFHDVMKKMLPDANGTTLAAVTAGDTFSYSVSHAFPFTYRLPNDANDPIDHSIEHSVEEWDDLRIVAWVQDPNDGEIWQSENAEITLLDSASNLSIETINGIEVYIVGTDSFEMFGDDLSPLGVKSNPAKYISVFPNPAKDMINISGVNGLTTVTIYDAAGRMVAQENVENNTVNIAELEAGIYNVIIENNGVQKTEKITVVH